MNKSCFIKTMNLKDITISDDELDSILYSLKYTNIETNCYIKYQKIHCPIILYTPYLMLDPIDPFDYPNVEPTGLEYVCDTFNNLQIYMDQYDSSILNYLKIRDISILEQFLVTYKIPQNFCLKLEDFQFLINYHSISICNTVFVKSLFIYLYKTLPTLIIDTEGDANFILESKTGLIVNSNLPSLYLQYYNDRLRPKITIIISTIPILIEYIKHELIEETIRYLSKIRRVQMNIQSTQTNDYIHFKIPLFP